MPNKNTHRYTRLKISLLLSFFMLSCVSTIASPNKYYLAIEHNISTDKNDLDITSVGMLSLKGNIVSSIKLSYLKSGINGKGSTLDLGGGYAFNGDISLYLLLGASLGYNWDRDDYITAYFPEAGIVMDFTKTLALQSAANGILICTRKMKILSCWVWFLENKFASITLTLVF